MSEVFEVTKVLDKKIENGQVRYLLKWKDYSTKYNRWVRVENCDCPDLVSDFEKNRMVQVISAKRQKNTVIYLMQTKKNTFETISSDEAKQFWPTLAADFLEKCVVWQMSSSQTDQFDHVKSEVEVKENVIPIRISYITKQMGKIFYLGEYGDGGVRFFASNETKKIWPNLVIQYLEPKFDDQQK